ncbi:YopX family protein [Enterococcus hirae]
MIPKFRAYSTEENEMYYPHNDENVDWTIDDETGFIAPLVHLGSCMWGMIDKYVLMQSTGLKDKNGVEIFEGDVVLVSVQNGFDYLNNKKTIVQKSEFHSGLICKSLDIGMEYRVFKRNEAGYEYEVIGNIYENSELLKEVKE